MTSSTRLLIIWMLSALVAVLVAMNFSGAALVEGEWGPVGNDSFYHARRILDAAEGERGFYQFDEQIHTPEGSWITWPWAYDYFIAKALQVIKVAAPNIDIRSVLVSIPVLWIFVNSGLLLLTTVALGLRWEQSALVMAAFSLSPLTQLLHGIGMLDHHYIEHTFVLLTLLLGLAWSGQPGNTTRAGLTGLVLGIAPAFHNGLFALQIPVLLAVFLFWIKSQPFPKHSLNYCAAGLVIGTIFAVAPSEPFWDGQFEFYTLSWFHFYIACCSALLLAFMGRFQFSARMLALLSGLGLALLLPISANILRGGAFLGRDILLLEGIIEAQSPITWFMNAGGATKTPIEYGALVWLSPLLLIGFLIVGARTANPKRLFFAVYTAFGLTLLLTQFRLHYFGSYALLLGWLLLLEPIIGKRTSLRPVVFAGMAIVLGLATYHPYQKRLFYKNAAGLDPSYQLLLPIYNDLAELCAENPGVAIASNGQGHYIRYRTDCSVIANNFLMSRQHEEKIIELNSLLNTTATEFASVSPDTRYIVANLKQIFTPDKGNKLTQSTKPHIRKNNPQLFSDLLLDNKIPNGFTPVRRIVFGNRKDLYVAGLYARTDVLDSDEEQAQ